MTKKYAVTYWAADVRHATEIIEADSAQAALEIARGEWTSWDMEDTGEPYDPYFARAIEVDADECEIADGELAEEEMDHAKIEVARLRSALEWISEGKGRFSADPLTHADNCIADMKQAALDALAGREFKEP